MWTEGKRLVGNFFIPFFQIKIKQFLVIISFIKLILLKIRVGNVKYQIYEWQRATANGVFHYLYETRHCQLRVCFLYIQNAQRSSSHLRGVWTKRITASGVFHKNNETRHWQWRGRRANIRIFEILHFSLLFLIILI
jgi:hypothetical protein